MAFPPEPKNNNRPKNNNDTYKRETLLSINQHYKKVGWLELNNYLSTYVTICLYFLNTSYNTYLNISKISMYKMKVTATKETISWIYSFSPKFFSRECKYEQDLEFSATSRQLNYRRAKEEKQKKLKRLKQLQKIQQGQKRRTMKRVSLRGQRHCYIYLT